MLYTKRCNNDIDFTSKIHCYLYFFIAVRNGKEMALHV